MIPYLGFALSPIVGPPTLEASSPLGVYVEGDWIPMNSIGDVLHDCRQTEGTQHADTLSSAGRRQRQGTRHILSLPSAARPAHGKGRARAQHVRQPCGGHQCI